MRPVLGAIAMVIFVSAPVAAAARDTVLYSSTYDAGTRSYVFKPVGLGPHPSKTAAASGRGQSVRMAAVATPTGSAPKFTEGSDLAAGQSDGATFRIGGHDPRRVKGKNNLSTAGTLAVGLGLVVLLAIALGVATDWGKCKDEGRTCD